MVEVLVLQKRQNSACLGIETKFVDGQRVTDEETLNLTEMVLSGKVNKNIVGRLNNFGIDAVGLSGKDSKTIIAKKKYHKDFFRQK